MPDGSQRASTGATPNDPSLQHEFGHEDPHGWPHPRRVPGSAGVFGAGRRLAAEQQRLAGVRVDRKRAQVAERGKTGPKVVDRDLDALAAQALDRLQGRFGVGDGGQSPLPDSWTWVSLPLSSTLAVRRVRTVSSIAAASREWSHAELTLSTFDIRATR